MNAAIVSHWLANFFIAAPIAPLNEALLSCHIGVDKEVNVPVERDILEVLRAESRFLEQGGYDRRASAARRPTLIFFDSATCVNLRDPQRRDPCSECVLMTLVPLQHRPKPLPCQHIPLNEAGDTANSLNERGDQARQYEVLANWLRTTIAQLEQEQVGPQAGASGEDCVQQS